MLGPIFTLYFFQMALLKSQIHSLSQNIDVENIISLYKIKIAQYMRAMDVKKAEIVAIFKLYILELIMYYVGLTKNIFVEELSLSSNNTSSKLL